MGSTGSDPPELKVREARTSQGRPLEAGVARQMSQWARTLQAEADPAQLLQDIVEAALVEVPTARYAGVTLIRRGDVSTEASTDPVVNRIDQAQYAGGDGPCVTSLREQVTVRSDDLRDEPRWPVFAATAVELGVESMLSAQLFVHDTNFGALNLYAGTPRAFDDNDEHLILLFASHAAIALASAGKVENLTVALDARDVIGQAKGILMERFKISSEHAFQILVAISQHHHRKLRDVAAELAATGEMPAGASAP